MKEQILKLKAEGKTYNEIKKILNCSKGTIAYHCGAGQKEKTTKRRQKRDENVIIRKTDSFKYSAKEKKNFVEAIRKYQKRDNRAKGLVDKNIQRTFTWNDVLNKFGENTICYLSGEKINLFNSDYNFDHIIPVTRGGQNTFDNLGILTEKINKMKSDMTPEELIQACIKILRFNGYNIVK